MTPDIKLNGTSGASMGWLRETISFPVPQSQTNTIVVPGRNSPIRFTEALGRISYLNCPNLYGQHQKAPM